ncbi:MAG: RNA polymerase sigma factor [bacterium]
MALIETSNKLAAEDRQLWERLRLDDEKALETLFTRHHHFLYDYCLKLARSEELAKDCIQEVFIYIWKKRKDIASVSSVKAYLLSSVRRHYLSMLEKNRKLKNRHQSLATGEDLYAFSPEDLVVLQEHREEKKELLQNAMSEIPARMREALYLRTFDELSYKEIAEVMQVSPQVAYNYVSEAFQRLKKTFLGKG